MKRIAIVGASVRGIRMYAVPLARQFADAAAIVGVYDPNLNRARLLSEEAGGGIPVFESFDEMIRTAKPDTVLVTTIDRYHHEYIVRALEAGCDVITEKPMTIDAQQCNAVLDAEARSGKRVTVTFNMRFMPFAARIKRLLREGAIGKTLNVHFEWLLDTSHGADYFRRWHRRMENSGGLLVHKSTHHFDLVNWYLEEEPVSVAAFGTRRFYGPTRDERGERCLTCRYKASCEFYLDITRGELKELYFDSEASDGYYRDRCVFSEEIDIFDSSNVIVRYSGGAMMSYTLTAHSPYEGFKLALNGTEGRLEAEWFHGETGPFAGKQIEKLRVFNRVGEVVDIGLPPASGDHGGGDERLRQMIFRGGLPDPFGQQASSRDGALSNMIGVAANLSIQNGQTVHIADLLTKEAGKHGH